MKRPTLRERFKYWFDGLMAHGTGALLGFLAAVVVVVVAVDAAVVLLLNIKVAGTAGEQGAREVVWQNLIRTLDVNDVSPGAEWAFRISMLLLTVIGVFIAANLIGIVSGAFDAKVAELRKGRSVVLEKGHTVILGWNSKIVSIVQELCLANVSGKGAHIVVLAEKGKVEMEDLFRDRIADPGRTKIICRTGDPLDQDDLLIANPYAAKSVIILADETGEDPDARTIKTALALTRHPERGGGHLHIVGQIRNSKNLEVARIVGQGEAIWILGSETVGQITAQTSRQPGLSAVYVDLLNFGGAEMYFTTQPNLVGKTYFDAQLAFATSAVMGIIAGEQVFLNPVPERVIGAADQLIVVAGDESTIALAEPRAPDLTAIAKGKRSAGRPEKTLVLGSNAGLSQMVREFDRYAAAGSTVTIVSEFDVPDLPVLKHTKVTVKKGGASTHAALEALKPASFNHVIVLAYSDNLGVQAADTKTLVTLLHLRDMMSRQGIQINVVSEMLDERNRKLAEVTRIDDFIVSDHLVSLMMSQVAENPHLAAAFADLFGSGGCEIYLHPADWFVTPGVEVDFYTVLAGARNRKATAIGYVAADAGGGQPTVVLNPTKTERRAYGAHDRIIVVSED